MTCKWASYQIHVRKIAGCACTGNAGNVFPHRRFQRKPLVSDPGMHHDTCVTHVPWCMSGLLTCGDGENVSGIPGACAPAILRIWQETHMMSHTYLEDTWLTDAWCKGTWWGQIGWCCRLACRAHHPAGPGSRVGWLTAGWTWRPDWRYGPLSSDPGCHLTPQETAWTLVTPPGWNETKCYRLAIYRGYIQHDCSHSPIMTVAKLRSNFALTHDNPYLALTGELWGVFRELFKEKWPQYIESTIWWVWASFVPSVNWTGDNEWKRDACGSIGARSHDLAFTSPTCYHRTRGTT